MRKIVEEEKKEEKGKKQGLNRPDELLLILVNKMLSSQYKLILNDMEKIVNRIEEAIEEVFSLIRLALSSYNRIHHDTHALSFLHSQPSQRLFEDTHTLLSGWRENRSMMEVPRYI